MTILHVTNTTVIPATTIFIPLSAVMCIGPTQGDSARYNSYISVSDGTVYYVLETCEQILVQIPETLG